MEHILTNRDRSAVRDRPNPASHKVKAIALWLVVCIPLIWGVWMALQDLPALLR
jgi:hypothetical protein